MKTYFLSASDFPSFLSTMLQATKVIGPVAKKHKFVFEQLSDPEELRLDYDVTILPPKKAIFPQSQALVKFAPEGYQSCLAAEEQVLFGVHPYDVKGLDMLDRLFCQGVEDRNYMAHREKTTIVASNIQRVSPRAFFASVSPEVKPRGHDAFLTAVAGGYIYEVRSDKGQALLAHGRFRPALGDQVALAYQVQEEARDNCPEHIYHSTREVKRRVRAAFERDDIWEDLSQKCFSCGSCNTTCPTCYCFDVQDKWNLDQVSGVRERTWDGCLLEDFAQVSLGGGATENFRERKAARFRHRVMRKTAYLNEKLDGPACVGCGRCSVNCVPDIADPVAIINRIMEG